MHYLTLKMTRNEAGTGKKKRIEEKRGGEREKEGGRARGG